MSKFSRDKGARFERQVAADLSRLIGEKVYRGASAQAQRSDAAPDVDLPGFWLECKVHATRYKVREALEQGEEANPGGRWTAGVCRRDRGPVIVAMTLDDFAEFYSQWRAGRA